MAGGSDIRAGKAYVELSIKDNLFTKGLRAAQAKLQSFGSGMLAIGAAASAAGGVIAGFAGAAIGQFTKFGDELDKARQRTGLSVESLSELRHAAEQSGTDFATLEKAIQKGQKNITEAAAGSQSLAEQFGEIGLSASKLASLSPEDQFSAIGAAINGISDPAKKTAAAMAIFGKSGTQLLPMLQDVDALRQEARDLGFVMSGESAAAAVKLGDTFANLMTTVKMAGVSIGGALAPALQTAAEAIQRVLTQALKFVQANGALIQKVAAVGAGLVAGGAAFAAIGTAAIAAGAALGGIATAISAVGIALRVASGPLGLITVAVGLLAKAFVGDLIPSTEGATSFISGAFKSLSTNLGPIIDSVREFVVGAFQTISAIVTPLVESVTAFIGEAWSGAVAFVTPIVQSFAVLVQDVFHAILAVAKPVWDGVANLVTAAWSKISEYTAPVLNWLQKAITTAFSAASFAIKNWQLLGEFAIRRFAFNITAFANDLIHWFTVALPAYIGWFRDNWRDVFATIASFVTSFATNVVGNLTELGKSVVANLKAIGSAIGGWLAGDEFKFEFQAPTFKPLLDGFENTMQELPKIAAREMGVTEAMLKEQMDKTGAEIAAAWQEHQAGFNARASNVGLPSPAIPEQAKAAQQQAEEAKKQAADEKQAAKDQIAQAAGSDRAKSGSKEVFATFSSAAAAAAGIGSGNTVSGLLQEQLVVARQQVLQARRLADALEKNLSFS